MSGNSREARIERAGKHSLVARLGGIPLARKQGRNPQRSCPETGALPPQGADRPAPPGQVRALPGTRKGANSPNPQNRAARTTRNRPIPMGNPPRQRRKSLESLVHRLCRAPDYAECGGEGAGQRRLIRSDTRHNPSRMSEAFFVGPHFQRRRQRGPATRHRGQPPESTCTSASLANSGP